MNSAPPPVSLVSPPAYGSGAVELRRSPSAWPARAFAPRISLAAAYLRSQLSAVLATLVDFVSMVALVEFGALHYVVATAAGAISGGVTAFLVNRHWSFLAGDRAVSGQALRYALVWAGSISLNCLFVYLMTDKLGFTYTSSKVATAVLVGAGFNFPLHRYFVFR